MLGQDSIASASSLASGNPFVLGRSHASFTCSGLNAKIVGGLGRFDADPFVIELADNGVDNACVGEGLGLGRKGDVNVLDAIFNDISNFQGRMV